MKTLQLTTSNLKTLVALWILSIGICVFATISIDNKYTNKAIGKRDKEINSLMDSILVQKTVNHLLREERLAEKDKNETTKKNRITLQNTVNKEKEREKFITDSILSLPDSTKTLLFARILAGDKVTK